MSAKKFRFADPTQAEALQGRCDQILEDTYAGNLLQQDKYKALREEYNILSRRLQDLHCGILPDPLCALPSELWVEIIREATYGNAFDLGEITTNVSSTDALLVLTLVCKEWANAIFSVPTLWTDIEMGHGDADAHAKLKSALYLSRGLSFNLFLYVPCSQEDINLSIARQNAHRIKEIIVLRSRRLRFHSVHEMGECMDNFFTSIGHFQSLRSIRDDTGLYVTGFMTSAIMLSICPCLAHIKYQRLALDDVRNWTGSRIQTCSVYAFPNDIIRHAEDFQNLEDLTLISPARESNATPYRAVGNLPTFPALKSISSYGQIDSYRNFNLLLTLAGRLTNLVFGIHGQWQHLYDFFSILEHLPYLATLDIRLNILHGAFSFPVTSTTPTRTRVRRLRVESLMSDGGSNISDGVLDTHDALYSVFSTFFPDVEVLRLINIAFGAATAHYIRSIARLRRLQLHSVFLRPNNSIQSFSLKTIDAITRNESHLNSLVSVIECPALSVCTARYLHESSSPVSRVERQGGCGPIVYDTIEEFNIDSPLRVQWETLGFTALRKLRIRQKASDLNDINELLIALTIEPANCPALEEIEFPSVFEWDLVFVMLERRNYLPASQGITPIHTIILDLPIPPALLSPLAEVLAGRFTTRPPNVELSFSGFMEAYFDPAVLGCHRCFSWIMHCSTSPIQPEGLTVGSLFSDLSLPTEQRGVPTDVWRWLRGRHDRLLKWRECEATQRVKRRPFCAEMLVARQRFVITGHPLPARI